MTAFSAIVTIILALLSQEAKIAHLLDEISSLRERNITLSARYTDLTMLMELKMEVIKLKLNDSQKDLAAAQAKIKKLEDELKKRDEEMPKAEPVKK